MAYYHHLDGRVTRIGDGVQGPQASQMGAGLPGIPANPQGPLTPLPSGPPRTSCNCQMLMPTNQIAAQPQQPYAYWPPQRGQYGELPRAQYTEPTYAQPPLRHCSCRTTQTRYYMGPPISVRSVPLEDDYDTGRFRMVRRPVERDRGLFGLF